MKKFFENSFGLIESIVCAILGALLIIIDVFTPPIAISTIVVGGIMLFIGAVGIVLEVTSKNK